MSKRKRASLGKTSTGDKPASEGESTSADDAAVKEDMAHVSPDILAGSPDIFAPKWTDPPAAAGSSEAVTEPIVSEQPSGTSETPAESIEPSAPSAAESAPVLAPEAAAAPPPPPVSFAPHPPRRRGGGSSAALGIVLVVVGLFALAVVLFGVDLTQYGWPLFVIIPGLTLLVVGFLGGGTGASVPGGIVTMLGLVLAYQSSTGDWASWAFAWAIMKFDSSIAERKSIWSVTLLFTTLRYGVSMKPYSLVRAYRASELISPMFGPSGVSIGQTRP